MGVQNEFRTQNAHKIPPQYDSVTVMHIKQNKLLPYLGIQDTHLASSILKHVYFSSY
jgi:hypothetical protein